MRPQGYGFQYDDMLGEVRSAIAGGTVWDVAAINDTGFIIGWLKDSSTDMFQLKIQAPHSRVLGSVLGDIHVHECLESASTAGQTIIWTTQYCWIKPGMVIPANSGWTTSPITTQTLTTQAAFYYTLFELAINIPAITAEDYGSILLVKVSRGDGTYSGRVGILDADAHSLKGKLGSKNTYTD
jgi:hypothetical protein